MNRETVTIGSDLFQETLLEFFPESCWGNQSSGRNSSQERYEYPARVPTTSLRHSMTGLLFISFLTSTIKGLVKLFSSLDIRSTGRLSYMNLFVNLRPP